MSKEAVRKASEDLIKQQAEVERARAELNMQRAHLASLQTEKAYLEKSRKDDLVTEAWCCDLSEGLAGTVGTIELNGETGAAPAIIRPGYSDQAIHVMDRDGQLQVPMSSSGDAVYFNQGVLPGVQKWKPTYRVGTLVSKNLDTCTVDLDPSFSSQQALNINRHPTLTNVPIVYMDCNGGAFDTGDRVVVEFTNHDWAQPRVIGFESNPKPCDGWIERFDGDAWDLGLNDDPGEWPAESLGVGTPNPISGTVPNPPGGQGSAYWDKLRRSVTGPPENMPYQVRASLTSSGHKLYKNLQPDGFISGSPDVFLYDQGGGFQYVDGALRVIATPQVLFRHFTFIPADAVNLLLPGGDPSGDAAITNWDRIEVDYESEEPNWYHLFRITIHTTFNITNDAWIAHNPLYGLGDFTIYDGAGGGDGCYDVFYVVCGIHTPAVPDQTTKWPPDPGPIYFGSPLEVNAAANEIWWDGKYFMRYGMPQAGRFVFERTAISGLNPPSNIAALTFSVCTLEGQSGSSIPAFSTAIKFKNLRIK